MKKFNKISTFLILAGFIYFGDAFAGKHIREESENRPKIMHKMYIKRSIKNTNIELSHRQRPTKATHRHVKLQTAERHIEKQPRAAKMKQRSETKQIAASARIGRVNKKAITVPIRAPKKARTLAKNRKTRIQSQTHSIESFRIPEQTGQWQAEYELNNGAIVKRTPYEVNYHRVAESHISSSHCKISLVNRRDWNNKTEKNHNFLLNIPNFLKIPNISPSQTQEEFLNELAKLGGIKKINPHNN